MRSRLCRGHERTHSKPRIERMEDRAQPSDEHVLKRIGGSPPRVAIRRRGAGVSTDKCRHVARSVESCYESVQGYPEQEQHARRMDKISIVAHRNRTMGDGPRFLLIQPSRPAVSRRLSQRPRWEESFQRYQGIEGGASDGASSSPF